MNDVTKKSSVPGVISLAIALLAGLCVILFKGIAVLNHYDDAKLIGALLSILLTPIGIIIGAIALFKRRIRHGLLGLGLNLLFLMVGVFIILKSMLGAILDGTLQGLFAPH